MITTMYRNCKGDKRYVRYSPQNIGSLPTFFWCEVQDSNRSVNCAQGSCTEDELPAPVAEAGRARAGFWPTWVNWPF